MQPPQEHPLARRVRLLGASLRLAVSRHDRKIVLYAMAIFILVFSLIGAWKYWSFSYNALDLAIYNQVATNTVHGHWFQFTIHPHSYLGDHLELFLVALIPFYAIAQHPLTLVILQTIALALVAYPIMRIAERFVGKPWHVLFGLAYLANPVIQNMTLFEFHMLPFAIPLLSLAILGYVKRKYWLFLIPSLLALTVREDVSLVVAGMGVLALMERRSWRWSVVPMVVGAGWFALAMKLTAHFSGYGQYKFLVYYTWLGGTVPEIIKHALLKPWIVLQHLFALSNVAFLIALLLPFAYLPIFGLRWLIPAAPIFLQILLVQSPGELLLSIHYPSLLLPFLVVASAVAFQKLLTPPPRGIFHALGQQRAMVIVIVVIAVVYSMLVIGPLAQAVPVVASTSRIADRVALERSVVRSLPDLGAVAGFETITELSRKTSLYSLHYVFLGKKQFSQGAYTLPDDAKAILLDLRDPLLYQLLYESKDADNKNGYGRIRSLIADRGFEPTLYLDRFVLYEQLPASRVPDTYSLTMPTKLFGRASTHGDLEFLGWSTPTGKLATSGSSVRHESYTVIPLNLTFMKNAASDATAQLEFRYLENGKLRYRVVMPFGGGVYPTSDWVTRQPVTSRYELLFPRQLRGKPIDLEARVLKVEGDVLLNGVRSLVLRYRKYETVGAPLELGRIEVSTL